MAPRSGYILFSILMAFSVSCDQGTKYWARTSLPSPKIVIDGYWDFRFAENKGAAFSMFHDFEYGRVLLSVIGIVALGFLFMELRKNVTRPWVAAGLGLVAGGAVGNLYDRIVRGRVTDFIHWHWQRYEWPIFNIADVVLVVGIGLLLIFMRPPPKAKKATS